MTDRKGKGRYRVQVRSLALLIALVLLAAAGVGATVAFLHMKTDSKKKHIKYGKVIFEVLEYFVKEYRTQ